MGVPITQEQLVFLVEHGSEISSDANLSEAQALLLLEHNLEVVKRAVRTGNRATTSCRIITLLSNYIAL